MRFDPSFNWGHIFTIVAILAGGGSVAISMKTDIAVLQTNFQNVQAEIVLIREALQAFEKR
jgi:hypothetical protein